jgi:8-oxo-dGTP pyrophosphatase MutT (NUDIX family)
MEAGAIFIIQNEAGRLLLEQRNANSKRSQWGWVFPGGKREEIDNDTLDTVVRESLEEFGIEINKEAVQKIGEIDREVEEGFLSIYLVKIIQPSKLVISESAGGGWFSVEEIEKMELGYSQKARIFPVLISFLESQKLAFQ